MMTPPSRTVTLSGGTSIAEGDSAIITATLSAVSGQDVTVTLTLWRDCDKYYGLHQVRRYNRDTRRQPDGDRDDNEHL